MWASQLENLLTDEAASTSLSHRSSGEFARRFDSLRAYGLLPKGRGHRSQQLSFAEISSAILSMAATNPHYAGLVAKMLIDLRPVGGAEASFGAAPSFGCALQFILGNAEALKSIVEVRISESEIYTNGHGRAAITYRVAEVEKTAHFVDQLAISLLQPGAESNFDSRALISTIVIETVIYPPFFRHLVRRLQDEARYGHLPHPVEPELEEDEEAKKAARAERLGLTSRSRFLHIAVDNQVTWPPGETAVDFEGKKLVLLPKTKDHTTSIHVDLQGQKLSSEEALTLINRFLSLLTWCDDQFAVTQDGWSGNPVPVPVSKRDLGFSTTYQWIFDRKSPVSPGARKAIAIYRDARNAEQNFLVSYAVLSYYKIIELKYKGRGATKNWFRDNLDVLKQDRNLTDRLDRFMVACGPEGPSDYLYRACRVAVAHANTPYSSDPDDANELRRLHIVAAILRPLVRRFIEVELGVSDSMFDGT